MAQNHSLYIHIPFCKHRCAYCDFNTYAGQEAQIPAYVDALCREIRIVGDAARVERSGSEVEAHTIFFGGGTPSLLSPGQFEKILKTIREEFDVLCDAEISLEANPGTVSQQSLRELHTAGFNRISLGVQSAHPDELRQLERIHNFLNVIEAVKWARQAGFGNLNLDLIYGLPKQTLERWQSTMRSAVDLQPEHLSLYALTVEHGTPFGRWAARGLMPMPDPDLAAKMYEWASDFLESAGYIQYEISNWALPKDEGGRLALSKVEGMKEGICTPSFACRHNLQYWRNLPYLGFGAGAHGCANHLRVANVLRIKTYIERLTKYQFPNPQSTNSQSTHLPFPRSPATCNLQPVNMRTQMQDTMLLGLRLVGEGVSDAGFHSSFGVGITEAFPQEVDELLHLGLVEWTRDNTSEFSQNSEVLRLTHHARLVANQAFMRFVD